MNSHKIFTYFGYNNSWLLLSPKNLSRVNSIFLSSSSLECLMAKELTIYFFFFLVTQSFFSLLTHYKMRGGKAAFF